MKKNHSHPNIDCTLDEFLDELGVREEITQRAIKNVMALELEDLRREQKVSKTELAKRMKTSRTAVNRLLDPNNTSLTLNTLISAAYALGKNVRISFI
jgi:transcriptional regulator with XRE-family HTH domain